MKRKRKSPMYSRKNSSEDDAKPRNISNLSNKKNQKNTIDHVDTEHTLYPLAEEKIKTEKDIKGKQRVELSELSDQEDSTVTSREKHANKDAAHLCEHCAAYFKRKWDLNLHIKRMHSSRKCDKCGEDFKNLRFLTEHLKFVHGVQPDKYFTKQCLKCDSLFQNDKSLENHMASHSDENLYSCTICDKKMKYEGSLKFHMKACHGADREKLRKHVCDVCKKKFYFKNDLLRHLLIHSKEKPHVCDICNVSYRFPGNLSHHYRSVHQGIKFSCDTCKKIFTSQTNLNRHSITHQPDYEQKKFSCDKCDKTFSYKSDLNKHLTVHTGERPFVCPVCRKTFRLKSHLKQHSVIHSGLKPFKCRFCGKGFTQIANVLCHEQKQCKKPMIDKCEQTDYLKYDNVEMDDEEVPNSLAEVACIHCKTKDEFTENESEPNHVNLCTVELCNHLNSTNQDLAKHFVKTECTKSIKRVKKGGTDIDKCLILVDRRKEKDRETVLPQEETKVNSTEKSDTNHEAENITNISEQYIEIPSQEENIIVTFVDSEMKIMDGSNIQITNMCGENMSKLINNSAVQLLSLQNCVIVNSETEHVQFVEV